MKCCLCEATIKADKDNYRWTGGHNPYPIVHKKGEKCCWDCNQEIVCVARLAIYMRHQKQIEKGEVKNGKVRRDEFVN
jgi:hypothetical protein